MILTNGSSARWTRRCRRRRARDRRRPDRRRRRDARVGAARRRTESICAVAACCPPSPTPTCTFPPGRSRDGTSRSRAPRRSTRRSRGSASRRAHGEWLRGRGWRDADWAREAVPQALDAVVGDTPAALWSKDYHSLWLSSAALARAGGDLDVPGGVVERDARRRADGHPARGVRLAVSRAARDGLGGRVGRGDARGSEARERARRRRDPRQGRLARRAGRSSAASTRATGLTLRVWQSLPAEQAGQLAELGLRSRIGDDYLRLGYLKAFMDGTLGSQTAWMLDGTRRRASRAATSSPS